MIDDPVLNLLKSATRDLHDSLESCVDLERRLVSQDQYRSLLQAFYGFYAPLESRFEVNGHLAAADIDFAARRKLPLLIRDLRHFDVQPSDLPLCRDLPTLSTPAASLGCLYVVEGATLGGQIIKRLLAERLAVTETDGGAFFAGYGDRTRERWEQFRQSLSAYVAVRPSLRDEIVDSARATFQKLEAWFTRTLAPSNSIRQTGDDGQ